MERKNKKEIGGLNVNLKKEKVFDQFSEKEGELKILLKKTIELSEKNQKDIKYIKKFVIWLQVWGVIKFLLILIPIIIGALYLPSFLNELLGTYQDLLIDSNIIQDSSESSILEKIIL